MGGIKNWCFLDEATHETDMADVAFFVFQEFKNLSNKLAEIIFGFYEVMVHFDFQQVFFYK